jgi:hypothetical protein
MEVRRLAVGDTVTSIFPGFRAVHLERVALEWALST